MRRPARRLRRAGATPHGGPRTPRAGLVLNHGRTPHPCCARIADVLVTFEGPWASYLAQPAQPRPGGPDVRLCHLVHGVPPDADPEGPARARGAAVRCAVPGTGDHPWGTLPYALRPTDTTESTP
ncbi:hypothetical protein ACIQU3_28380 [Streptomyces sp. NPDC101110]|uniref:hypothetical protein n=1 Tax=unclassified Streptomyces TaxID=2593676 RepID=UPI00380F147E